MQLRSGVYYQDTPPEVDNEYMARVEEIKANAKITLTLCKNDFNYNFLLFSVSKLNSKIKEQACINAVIGYVRNLEIAITENDLISMRRANADRYITAFKDCANRVNDLYHDDRQFGQLSLW